jgi:hypothetical protein
VVVIEPQLARDAHLPLCGVCIQSDEEGITMARPQCDQSCCRERNRFGVTTATSCSRTPAVDAPIAILSGVTSAGGGILCSLFGQTTPLSAAQLSSLYPTHGDYVSKLIAGWLGSSPMTSS